MAALRKVQPDANATECSKTEVFEGTMQGKCLKISKKF